MNHKEFIALFREVARRHKQIQHTEEEMHFARIILPKDPFMDTGVQISEFIESVKNSLHTPALVICAYEGMYLDDRSDEVEKTLAGRMIILNDVQLNNYDEEGEALGYTEDLGEQCLGFVENYFTENPDKGFWEWGGATSEKISKLTTRNFFGTAFEFSIKVSAQENIYFNPDNFIE